jgi:hypothetical protein
MGNGSCKVILLPAGNKQVKLHGSQGLGVIHAKTLELRVIQMISTKNMAPNTGTFY